MIKCSQQTLQSHPSNCSENVLKLCLRDVCLLRVRLTGYQWEAFVSQWQTAESSFLCYRLLGNWIGPPEKFYPKPSLKRSLWHPLERRWGWGGHLRAPREWVALPSSVVCEAPCTSGCSALHSDCSAQHGKCVRVPLRASWASQTTWP